MRTNESVMTHWIASVARKLITGRLRAFTTPLLVLPLLGCPSLACHDVAEAIRANDIEALRRYHDDGVDIDCVTSRLNDNGASALYLAVHHDAWECFLYLLESGADPNVKTRIAGSAMHAAACKKTPRWAAKLHEYGGDVNSYRREGTPYQMAPLHSVICLAGSEESVETTRWFIENGADIEAIASEDTTPLSAALSSYHLAIAAELVEAGASLDAVVLGKRATTHIKALCDDNVYNQHIGWSFTEKDLQSFLLALKKRDVVFDCEQLRVE